ncbi:hypothetical protein G6F31_016193 [Rhizopus arrhizus]|nr:hypothetical protein G6F31_016193 [Rhizopus arrhizus]
MGNDRRTGAALDLGQATEHLWHATTAAGDRQRLKCGQAVHAVLRRGGDHAVGDAVLRAQPECRGDLAATGQRRHHAVGDIALGDAQPIGAKPIDLHLQGRVAIGLLQAQVAQARHVAQAALQFLRIGAIAGRIRSGDAHVQRCRRTAVEDLAAGIGGQQRTAGAREGRRQYLAQASRVFGGIAVTRFQRDLDVTILRTDGAGSAVSHVDAGHRQAEVVDDGIDFLRRQFLADARFDAVE